MYATLENPHSIRPPFFGLPIRQVPNNALSAIWSQFRSLGHRLNGYLFSWCLPRRQVAQLPETLWFSD